MSEKKHLICGYCSTGCALQFDPEKSKFPVSAKRSIL